MANSHSLFHPNLLFVWAPVVSDLSIGDDDDAVPCISFLPLEILCASGRMLACAASVGMT